MKHAQSENQEPVAWRFKDPKDGHWLYTTHIVDLSKKYWRLKNEVFEPLYTTPPAAQSPLVELTASTILNMMPGSIPAEHDGALMEFARDIEAKLKECNT